MLKGSIAGIVMLIGLIPTFAVIFYDITPFWYEGQREEAILHRDIYMMNNSILAARSYMDTALSYSAYQACYDVLNSTEHYADENEFKTFFEASILDYINRYRSDKYYFMSNYPVTIPEYTLVVIESMNPLKIRIESESNIYISLSSRGDERRLESTNVFEKTIDIDCYGAYTKTGELDVDQESVIRNKITEVVNGWPHATSDLPQPDQLPDLNSLEAELEPIIIDFVRSDPGMWSISVDSLEVGYTYSQNSVTGDYDDIKYEVTLKLRLYDSESEGDPVYPVFDGEKITFAPLTTEPIFELSYAD